jgi:NAD(P)-dependent dehydrogenase (short-subunit alcohol dehydrogenase family)
MKFSSDQWALILGGSSGFGLATARKLASCGMSVAIVHRDRRGAMEGIEPAFSAIRAAGAELLTFNTDALSAAGRTTVLDGVAARMADRGRVRLLLHSIAFGNLKLLVPPPTDREAEGSASSPRRDPEPVLEEEDFAHTIHAMGTSIVSWAQDVLARRLFAADARVLGLTSEGNAVAWRGYAAVAAAKVAMESVTRAMALELAPHGVRANVVQAGVADTPALRLIPGNAKLKADALRRNPFGRLTTPEDVADAIALLCTDEARWINGTIVRVDGGERIGS